MGYFESTSVMLIIDRGKAPKRGNYGQEEDVYVVEDLKELENLKVWVCCPVCGEKLFAGKSFENVTIKCHCGTFVEVSARHMKIRINVESIKLKA